MLGATCGSSRTSRLRSLADKGRLPWGPTYRTSRRTRIHFAFRAILGLWPGGPIRTVRKYLAL